MEAEYELIGKASTLKTFVCTDDNVVVVKVQDSWKHKLLEFDYTQVITLSREIDMDLGMPETGWDKNIGWIKYKFPDGFEYVIAYLIDGVEISPPEIYPDKVSRKAILKYSQSKKNDYQIYVAVVTSMDSDNPFDAALKKVRQAAKKGGSKIEQTHNRWWRKFWGKSGIELENKFLEGLWYFSLYQFASSSQGETAPGLFGLWNGSKTPPWSGDYHAYINLPMTYWPIFSSNHIELGEPFFKTFQRLATPAKKRKTSQICGDEFGICDVCVGGINGIEEELIDAFLVPGTGSDYCPCSFAPSHAGPTSRALCDTAVYYHKTNSLFRSVICRRNSLLLQE